MAEHLQGQAVLPVLPLGEIHHPAAGTFVIISKTNLDKCDEYFLVAQFPAGDPGATPEWIALTTEDDHPHRFIWKLLELHPGSIQHGGFIMMNSALANRAPMSDVDYPINLICTGEGMPVWARDHVQLASIVTTGFRMQQEILQARAYMVAQGMVPGPAADSIPRVPLRVPYAPMAPPMGGILGLPMAPAVPHGLLAPGPRVVPPVVAPPQAPAPSVPGQAAAPDAGHALGFAAPQATGDGSLTAEIDALKRVMEDMHARQKKDKKDKKEKSKKESTRNKKRTAGKNRKKKKEKGDSTTS